MQNIKGKERRNRMEITQTVLERMENNTLNLYGHYVTHGKERMTQVNIDLVAGRKKKKRKTEKKWKREVECVTNKKNLTLEDKANRQIWCKATEKQ